MISSIKCVVFHINCYRASEVDLVAGVDNSDDTALIDIVVFSISGTYCIRSPRKFVLPVTIKVNNFW